MMFFHAALGIEVGEEAVVETDGVMPDRIVFTANIRVCWPREKKVSKSKNQNENLWPLIEGGAKRVLTPGLLAISDVRNTIFSLVAFGEFINYTQRFLFRP